MQLNKIIVYKVLPYPSVNIRVTTVLEFAKFLGWKCDVFENMDILKHWLAHNLAVENEKTLPALVTNCFRLGMPVVRTIDSSYSIVYRSLGDFMPEVEAESWVRSQCKFCEFFSSDYELSLFIDLYTGANREEIVSRIIEWLKGNNNETLL